MTARSAILSGFLAVAGSAVLTGVASLLVLMAAGDAVAKDKRSTEPSDVQYKWEGTMAPATVPSSPPAQPLPQITKQSQQPAESVLDYYDGLRAWDLGERVLAGGIWIEAAAHGDRRAIRRVAQLYEEGNVFPKDDVLAFFWFGVANRLGDTTVAQDIERISKRLTASSVASIKLSIVDWKRK